MGRGGLGNIYTWAAGNGLTNDDNVNYDGYANSRYTIAVGAIDHNGNQSFYSEPGSPMLVTSYSNGGRPASQPQICSVVLGTTDYPTIITPTILVELRHRRPWFPASSP